jgi:PTS system nitrogen regulatory IIA component
MQLTVREAARFLNVSEKTIYRWTSRGSCPVCRVNGQYRFNRDELVEWAAAHNIRVAPEILDKPGMDAPVAPLADALLRGGVFHKVPGPDRSAALKAMIQRLRLPEGADRGMLYEVMAARPDAGVPSVGDGIGIPHVRSPIVLDVSSPMVALFFLEGPVPFGVSGGAPLHTLFWVVSPTPRAHLTLLSRLASALHDPGFRAVVGRQASEEEILAEARRADMAPVPGERKEDA